MGAPPTIELGSLGMADSLILMVLALVVFGPRRLPQIGRQIGKLMYEFRKASNDFKFQMEEELRVAEEADRRKKEEEQRKQQALSQPAQESVSATPAVASAIGSPYAGEATYPPATTPEGLKVEEPEPRILPPSTGEPIAAERPARATGMAGEAEAATAPDVPEQSSGLTASTSDATAEAATKQENAPATEAVSHNG
jgi:sec-independent protein translocase protein TatB